MLDQLELQAAEDGGSWGVRVISNGDEKDE